MERTIIEIINMKYAFIKFIIALCCFNLTIAASLAKETFSIDTTFVNISTNKGDILVALYNDTPIHRDNFIKNIKEKAYDGLLFHRVIRRFMIQGGNPNSQNLSEDSTLMPENSKNLLSAEIIPQIHFHKRGALAAARTPDEVNPQHKSSSMQFYIVTGDYYTADDLQSIEEEHGIVFSEKQKYEYMHNGGAPSLDGSYTVFGEVIKGYDVVDDIQNVETLDNDRPKKNIFIKTMTISNKYKK